MKQTGRPPTSIVPIITTLTTSRDPKTTILVHLVALIGLGLLSAPLLAQPSTPTETFGEVVDVRVINLDVVVTDRDGNRVPGLQPSDFVLRVDGEERPIDYFTEVREGRAFEGDADGPRNAPSVTPGAAVPTNYLVFLDTFFGWSADQARLVKAVVDQLGELGPRDQVAVVGYDGQRVYEVNAWTSSRRQVEDAVRRIEWPSKAGASPFLETSDYDASQQIRSDYEAEGTGPEGGTIEPFADPPELQMYSKKLDRNLDRVARAISATLHGYSSVEGRKVMLLLSGGWPSNSVEFYESPQFGDAPNNAKTAEVLQRISNTANLLGFTLYAVDTPRNRTTERRELYHHATLDDLAKATGGRTFKNMTSLDALSGTVEDTRSYYWMGFTAPGSGDGERHGIKLEVRRPGLEVRARREFVDLTRQDQVSELVESAALVGRLPSARPLDLALGTARHRGRRNEVPITLRVPLDGLVMLPSAEGYTARLELRITAIDENGYLNEIPVIPWTFSGPEPQPGQHVFYETALELRRLDHRIVVALYDLNSGAILMGESALDL